MKGDTQMKIFRKAAAFLLAAVMAISMAPQTEAAESGSYPAPNALIKEIEVPVIVNKLLEGREAADSETFTFHVEPISDQAVYYAENGYLTYTDTITVGSSSDSAPGIAECLLQSELNRYGQPAEGVTEAQMSEMRDYYLQDADYLLSYLSSYLDDTDGMWASGLIYITGHQEINDNGVLFPLIADGDYTFRITEERPESSDLVMSKAVWELNINVNKPDKWAVNWMETYTLTRVTDDQGNPDGTKYEVTYVDGLAMPVTEFTNTYMEGSAVIQPADMTVYMNGEEGYEGVVADETGAFQSSDSLPEAGYYVTLPDEIDAMLKEVWENSDDEIETAGQDGTQGDVFDLSDYVTFLDSSTGRSWTLEMYSGGYSMAYGKYVYRLVPADGQGPVLMKFTDRDGNICTSDEFSIKGALYEDYGMELYLGAADTSLTAQIRIGENEILTVPVDLNPGKLRIRYVTKEQSEAVTELMTSPEQLPAEEGEESSALKQAAGIVSPETVFYINESQIMAGENAKPSLLFDDVVSSADGAGDYGELLRDTALNTLDQEFSRPQYEAKYIDLVDANNGNAWLTADGPVTVYWPYPEGTDSDTQFYLVHFKGLNREMQTASVESLIAGAETEVMEIQTDEYGIRFTADSFSPYVLIWDSPADSSQDTPDTPASPAVPAAKTGDTAVPAAWAVLAVAAVAAGTCVLRRKYRK